MAMHQQPTLGFIGTGGISEATIVGLCHAANFQSPISISERSKHRSIELGKRFENVTVHTDNQTIIDQSDWVIISVLPEQVASVVRMLKFRPDQKVISLAAGISLETLKQMVEPAVDVCRMIPMPPIELGAGPIVVCPPDQQVAKFFECVGTVVCVESETQFTAFSTSSAVMATFFELVAAMARWLERQNVPPAEAARYATSLFHSLSQATRAVAPDELQQMSRECLTIGGLNEQVLNELKQLDWFSQLDSRWDRILERLNRD